MSRPSRIVSVLVLVLVLVPGFVPRPSQAGVTITVLDVGQGDATLVQSTSGMTLLFDGGPSSAAQNVILPYLTSLGIETLDYIVVSHYHADHVGGVAAVYNRTGATLGVWDRGWSYTTATYTSYASAVAADRQTLAAGQVLDLGDGVTATVLALNSNGVLNPPFSNSNRENEYGVALLIECGDFDYFQAGDLPGINNSSYVDIETSVALTMQGLGKADLEVYKVNHHGSYSSSNAFFLNTTLPEVAVISVGATNSYGHPHPEPLQRLQQRGVHVYMTTPGNGSLLPPEDMTIVGGHIVIQTSGLATYTVDGTVWQMDEQGQTTVQPTPPLLVLHGNHPNPFNPSTQIAFSSANGGPGRLEVLDVAGHRHWQTAFTAPPGTFQVGWDGRGQDGRLLPAGVYLYRLLLPDGRDGGRMVLAK